MDKREREEIATEARRDVAEAFDKHGPALAAALTLPARDGVVERLIAAVKSFRNADTEYQRAKNADQQPRLNKAGTRYWCAKTAMFKVLDEALSSLPAVDYCGWVETEPVVNRGEHGPQCQNYMTACQNCIDDFERWKAIAALTTDDRAVR